MNILIVKTSAIGDVIHTLPSLSAIRKHYPQAAITWLVEEAAADIIRGHAALDRVLVSKRKSWLHGLQSTSCPAVLREIWQFIRELRDTEYDLIIDFQGLLKSGILIGLARGKRKVGYGRGMEHAECSYIFLNERIPAVSMDQHAIKREQHLLRAIGINPAAIRFDIPVSPADRARLQEILANHGLEPSVPLVAINPVATWKTKLWDSKKFAQVADNLRRRKITVVFTGSGNDRGYIDTILSDMQEQAVNLAGATDLKTLAALYERAGLVISTDTGPMHLAAALGTPVVAVFGPTAPWRTGPFGEQHKVVRCDLACSPCFKKQCEQFDCMPQISVVQVMAAVDAIIGDPH